MTFIVLRCSFNNDEEGLPRCVFIVYLKTNSRRLNPTLVEKVSLSIPQNCPQARAVYVKVLTPVPGKFL